MYEKWFPTLSTGTTNCRNLATENAGGNAGRATGCVSNASAITNAVSCVTSAPSRVARWSNQTVYFFTDVPLFFLDIFFGISADLSRMTESMVILASTLSTPLTFGSILFVFHPLLPFPTRRRFLIWKIIKFSHDMLHTSLLCFPKMIRPFQNVCLEKPHLECSMGIMM